MHTPMLKVKVEVHSTMIKAEVNMHKVEVHNVMVQVVLNFMLNNVHMMMYMHTVLFYLLGAIAILMTLSVSMSPRRSSCLSKQCEIQQTSFASKITLLVPFPLQMHFMMRR